MNSCLNKNYLQVQLKPLLILVCCLASTTATARDFVLLVTGVGGEAAYTDSFIAISDQLRTNYIGQAGIGQAGIGQAGVPDETTELTLIRGDDATADAIRNGVSELSNKITSGDTFTMMLLGHGSYDGENYKFNVPGSDLTGGDIKELLSDISAERQLILLGTSASGAVIKSLQADHRILVTATKNGSELNAVRFPRFWAEALSSGNADYDRNELITAEEAFRYAVEQTELYYKDRNLLATEHARLVGLQAAQFTVTRTGSLRGTSENPIVTALLDERLVLESELVKLIDAKSEMSLSDYFDALEKLMLKMARLQHKLDTETGWIDHDTDSDLNTGGARRG